MGKSERSLAFIRIHIAVLLFGFTAIFGELIHLSALVLVWWRVLITSISLLFFVQLGKIIKELPRELLWKYVWIGSLTGLHWLTFFGAIKLSNASLTLICLSTTSFMTSLIEPLIIKRKWDHTEIITGSLMIPGMMLVVNNIELSYLTGMLVGLLSALIAVIFSILNKKYIDRADPYTISFIELTSGWMTISIILLGIIFWNGVPQPFVPATGLEWLWIIILALVCTTLAQILTLKSLKQLTTFTVNLTINLEPVYGILLAALLLKEHHQLNGMFYAGAAIIFLSVFIYPVIQAYQSKPKLN